MTNEFRQDGVQDRFIEGLLSNQTFMTEFMNNYLDNLTEKQSTDLFQNYLNKTHNHEILIDD